MRGRFAAEWLASDGRGVCVGGGETPGTAQLRCLFIYSLALGSPLLSLCPLFALGGSEPSARRRPPLSPSDGGWQLSPSPPPTRVTSRTGSGSAGAVAGSAAALSRTVHCSAQSSSAKRRRANDTDSEASSFAGGPAVRTRVTQQASASGRVTVDEVDQEGKFVKLGNKADEVRPRRRRWLMFTCSMCGSVLLLWSYDTVDMLLVGSVGIEPQNLGTGSVNGMLLPSRDSPIVSCHI